MPTVLMTAPYMIPFLDRFKPVFAKYGIELIVPDVQERMEEDDLLKYAGQFDGAICGDDRYTARVIEACSPRLKIISKWGTGVDFDRRLSLFPFQCHSLPEHQMPSPPPYRILSSATCSPLPAEVRGWMPP